MTTEQALQMRSLGKPFAEKIGKLDAKVEKNSGNSFGSGKSSSGDLAASGNNGGDVDE